MPASVHAASCSSQLSASGEPLYHYVVVRSGLPVGVVGAQIAHAAGESSPGNLGTGTYAVVLQADSGRLRALEERLIQSGVPHKAIRENDPPYSGELLAIGLQPAERRDVQVYVSELPLLR